MTGGWPRMLTAWAVLLACEAQHAPWDSPTAGSCAADSRAFKGTIVAGSGAALPFAREILMPARNGRVWVAESIGTSGAARALKDGAIDIGLATRSLSAGELHPTLRTQIIAYAPLALVTSAPDAPGDFSIEQLQALWKGEPSHWPNGSPVVLLARETGDSGEQVIERTHPALFGAIRAARDEGRALELTTDAEMRDALLALDGAIGFLDLGVARLEAPALRILSVGGAQPVPGQHAPRPYPYWRPVHAVWAEPVNESNAAVLHSLLDVPEDVLQAFGYAPGKTPP